MKQDAISKPITPKSAKGELALKEVSLFFFLAMILYSFFAVAQLTPHFRHFTAIRKSGSLQAPFITSFQVKGKERKISPSQTVEIEYYENSFSLSYIVTDLANPHYAYQLEGFDPIWTDAGDRQYVNYTNLPGGIYKFKLKATADGTNWVEMTEPVLIRINIPFYKTAWFIIVIAFSIFITAVLVIYFAQRMQLQRILMTQKIRNNIAGDLHDDIGSSLSSIMLMSELANKQPQQAANYLNQISQTAYKIIESMNDIVWAINPDNDTIEQMLARMQEFASALLEKKNINLQFNTVLETKNLKLEMVQRKNLYLIFKEAIHNAFKYADCNNVEVLFKQDAATITLKIEDNGKGFDTGKKGMGNGLYNLQKRSAEINGSMQITSIADKGTTILLVFKITQTGSYTNNIKS